MQRLRYSDPPPPAGEVADRTQSGTTEGDRA